MLAKIANGGRLPDYVRVSRTDDVADLMGGAVDALLRPAPGPYPGMHAETIALHHAFAPHREATLVVWPGLARCREFLKVKSLLEPARQKDGPGGDSAGA